jgi:hypothetical protein
MEAEFSISTSVGIYQTSRCLIPEDDNLIILFCVHFYFRSFVSPFSLCLHAFSVLLGPPPILLRRNHDVTTDLTLRRARVPSVERQWKQDAHISLDLFICTSFIDFASISYYVAWSGWMTGEL